MSKILNIAALAGLASALTTTASYGQCGGGGVTAACPASQVCCAQNQYYAQCTPSTLTSACSKTGAAPTASTLSTVKTTAAPPPASSSAKPPPSSSAKPSSSSAAPAPASSGVKYAGVNIAGCDFGIDTTGTAGSPYCPTSVALSQMQHFSSVDGFNIFRLPVGWQYLVANKLGGTLDATFFSTYNSIVQNCLSIAGAKCIVDVHNYARWNGGIIGQGGPTNDQFVSLWSQLAAKYAGNANVVFGIMNEPHDLVMTTWAQTVQLVVNAIRAAGATSQLILVPGTQYTSASAFVQQSAPALSTVKDTDGTTSKLIYDVHQYFDSDNSGTHTTCTQNHSSDFNSLASYLRANGRQALASEVGGANDPTCYQYVCQGLATLNANADVFLGWTGWAAGSFDTSYVLTETPSGTTDQPIVASCIAGQFHH